MPDWLPEDARGGWNEVLADLEAANVPLQRIDAHAIGLFIITSRETRKAAAAGDMKLVARLGRDALAWAAAIGASPAARARLNIKPERPEDPDDPWAALDN